MITRFASSLFNVITSVRERRTGLKTTKSMANNCKKYMTPEVKVVNINTAPLLSASGNVSGENGTWVKSTADFDEDEVEY